MRLLFALTLLALACNSSNPVVEDASLGTLSFQVPVGWQKRFTPDVYSERVELVPTDNPEKQSLVIVHTSAREATLKAGPTHIEHLLELAQRSLDSGSFRRSARFSNHFGFRGAKIEGSFVPPGQSQRYERLHAVAFDPRLKSFVHVIYTARRADRGTFEIVLNSIAQKGA